jgi:hypothetical protein
MKAKPIKITKNDGGTWLVPCEPEDATHVQIVMPGPSGLIMLPVLIKGQRQGTNCWTWNGDTEKPTLRPSVLTKGADRETGEPYVCHTWVNDGQAQFLSDCSHEYVNQTIDLLDIDEDNS